MSVKQLWAPWRMEFIENKQDSVQCIFCHMVKQKEDRKNLILYRSNRVFVMLNKFPYNNGHLMIIPYSHFSDLTHLPEEDVAELGVVTKNAVKVIGDVYRPEGFNVGMNLGISAGAGIKDHLHLHVVPRWIGDTNFMPVLADTKSMPEHLLHSYDKLAGAFRNLR